MLFLLLCFWPSLLLLTIYNQSRTSLCITPHTATWDQLWEQNVCLKWNCWKWACTCSLCLFLWDCHAMWLCADAGALSACPLLTGSRCCCHEDTAHAVLSARTKPVTGVSCKFKSSKVLVSLWRYQNFLHFGETNVDYKHFLNQRGKQMLCIIHVCNYTSKTGDNFRRRQRENWKWAIKRTKMSLTGSMQVILLKDRSNHPSFDGCAKKWLIVYWRPTRSVRLLLLRRREQLRYFPFEFVVKGRSRLRGSSANAPEPKIT